MALPQADRHERLLVEFESAWKQALTGGPQPTIEAYLSDTLPSEQADLRRRLDEIHREYQRRWSEARRGSVGATIDPDTQDGNSAAAYGATIAHEPEPAAESGAPKQSDTSQVIQGATVDLDASSPAGPGQTMAAALDEGTFQLAGEPSAAETGGAAVAGYEILGELGRGGMGVVYRARQKKLDRVVALKMVLAGAHAGPDQLARFYTEAQAVAHIQHPNIVQIYEVGEQGGLPYFSLEFVDGGSLDKKTAGKPQEPREAAELVEKLARAMYAAHQKGVVHRDLKPANVLLMADGTPKITDFGLAKRLEGESSQTRSGAILGTPSYMAPEQAKGETHEIGPLADVYALGAVLYELITGRPPFVGPNPMDTVIQVTRDEPVPPTRLQPRLPPDVETICLKCLQKEPQKRYATAEALAEDLRRFLAGEPILARPISAPERLWRWCRRNRGLAASLATVAALLVIVAVVSTVMAVRINQEKKLAISERNRADQNAEAEKIAHAQADLNAEEARTAQKLAEENSQAARQAQHEAEEAKKEADENAKEANDQAGLSLATMQTVIVKIQQQLEDTPRTQPLKKELLQTVLEGLKKVSKRAEGSGAKTAEGTLAVAHFKMGQMFRQFGDTEEAFKEFTTAYEIVQRRAKLKPRSDKVKANVAVMLSVLGDISQELRRDMNMALKYHLDALKVREDLYEHPQGRGGEDDLEPDAVKQDLAEAHMKVGATVFRLGEPVKAVDHFENAVKLRRELAEAQPKDVAMQQNLARSYMGLAEMSFRANNLAAAKQYHEESLRVYAAVFEAARESLRAKQELARAYGWFGQTLVRAGELQAAKPHLERSLELTRELLEADPDNAAFLGDLGHACYRIATLARLAKDVSAAVEYYRECKKAREELAKDVKNDSKQIDLMLVLPHCGEHEKAAQIAAKLCGGSNDSELLFDAARCYAQCAIAAGGDQDLEQRYLGKAIEALSAAVALGYKDVVALETEPDLDALRDHPDYKKLIAELKRP